MPALRAPLQAAHSFRWRYLWRRPAPVDSSSITQKVAPLFALTILSASHFMHMISKLHVEQLAIALHGLQTRDEGLELPV